MLLVTYAVTGSYAQAGAVSTVSTIACTVMMLPGRSWWTAETVAPPWSSPV